MSDNQFFLFLILARSRIFFENLWQKDKVELINTDKINKKAVRKKKQCINMIILCYTGRNDQVSTFEQTA